MLVDLAMSGIAQAAAMAEDVERPGIAVLPVSRRVVVGLRVVEENTTLIGGLAMEDAADLQIGPRQPVLRRSEVDRYRSGGEYPGAAADPPRCIETPRPGRTLLAWRGSPGGATHQPVPPIGTTLCAAAYS